MNSPKNCGGGVCVDGFTLICNEHEHDVGTVAIQHMTTLDVAKGVDGCATLRAAARLAEGLREAMEIERKGNLDGLMDKLRRAVEQKG